MAKLPCGIGEAQEHKKELSKALQRKQRWFRSLLPGEVGIGHGANLCFEKANSRSCGGPGMSLSGEPIANLPGSLRVRALAILVVGQFV